MNSLQCLGILTGMTTLWTSSCHGWSLIDDFEDCETVDEIVGTWVTESPEAGLYLLADPQNAANSVLHIFTGHIGVDWANTHFTIPLSDSQQIGPGDVATIYWRGYEEGTDNNWGVGVSDLDRVSEWPHYVAVVKVNETSTVSVYHRRTYWASYPPLEVPAGGWSHYWLVIDFDAQNYQLWVRRPGEAEPVQQRLGRDQDETRFGFRRKPKGALDSLVLTSNSESPGAPNRGDAWFLDDFYITEGIDLSVPHAEEPAR